MDDNDDDHDDDDMTDPARAVPDGRVHLCHGRVRRVAAHAAAAYGGQAASVVAPPLGRG